jgi:protein disulfide-isomerase
MKKIPTLMKKLLFLLLTVFSISCGLVSNSEEPAQLWETNVNEALSLSKETGKPVFAFFTGKEWCSWCKKLDRQILQKEAFINYAKENLILLELDFPRGRRELPQEQINLARKFRIQGYPTVILMDSETNLLGQTGYENMTPQQYVAHIEKMISKK